MSRRPRAGEAGRPFTIKIVDAERATWLEAAGERSLSDWARTVLNREAKRKSKRGPSDPSAILAP